MGTLGLIAEVTLKVFTAAPARTEPGLRDGRSGRSGLSLGRSHCPYQRRFWHGRGIASVRAEPAVLLPPGRGWGRKLPTAVSQPLRCGNSAIRFRRAKSWRLALPKRPPPLVLRNRGLSRWEAASAGCPGKSIRGGACGCRGGGATQFFRRPSPLRCRVGAFAVSAPAVLELHRRVRACSTPSGIFNPGASTPSSEHADRPLPLEFAATAEGPPCRGHCAERPLRLLHRRPARPTNCWGTSLTVPRGRIYLIKQVLEGKPATQKTRLHLDRCLTCRSCDDLSFRGRVRTSFWTLAVGSSNGPLPRTGGRPRAVLTPTPRPWLFGPAVPPWLPAGAGRCCQERLPISCRRRRWRRSAFGLIQRRTPSNADAGRLLQPSLAPNINAAAARILDRLGIALFEADGAGCWRPAFSSQ